MSESNGRKMSLTERLASVFKSKPPGNRLTKEKALEYEVEGFKRRGSRSTSISSTSSTLRKGSSGEYIPAAVDIQTGERRDYTALLHGLNSRVSLDSDISIEEVPLPQEIRKPGEAAVASLSIHVWEQILSHLSPTDTANLAYSSKMIRRVLGQGPWLELNLEKNYRYKIAFLRPMDQKLPHHLLCFVCASYHVRVQEGHERLKANEARNPLFKCPNVTKMAYRHRLASGNALPFQFVQLVTRARLYGSNYGITEESLSRRWKDRDSDWNHQTRYYTYKGHLLVRVISMTFASHDLPPSAQRTLLYTRSDYTPYFSMCSHWKNGLLMDICKCALMHIPKPKETARERFPKGIRVQNSLIHTSPIVTLCSFCRPMRRCPECPTEYLIEIKFGEDKNDPIQKFKQALVVTRWSDLGDGSTPFSPEWAACNGEGEYKSLEKVGRRTISGTFESQNGVAIAGQRVLSLNPQNVKRSDDLGTMVLLGLTLGESANDVEEQQNYLSDQEHV